MKEKIAAAYDRLAKDYERNVDVYSGHNAYYERPAMLKLMPSDMKQLTVLDAGCAAGWYTEQLLSRGATVTAVDLSAEMVAACQRRVGDQATVLQCDLSEPLPFENESFDLIVSSLTLHYIEDWKPTFREFHRVLKAGGSLLFSVHHPFMDFTHFDRPDYFAHEQLREVWHKKESGPVEVTFYRRPIQDIINVTVEQFSIQCMVEPQPVMDNNAREAFEIANWYDKWFERLMTHPHFLVIHARKRS
ncbi:class I SAM-dependent methyltransferase [Paenibacillus sp. FSL K6-1230]|uniref:class I SAM-dependent methyltransferase n=1 Tax=Paenibacillus sp. FSL K6-1230 TaxID=2921603 RepID=UPI0003A5BF4F